MKIRIDDIQTPCSVCTNHFNHEFDGDTSDCESCDYNIAVTILKKVLRENDYCSYCTHEIPIKGGYWECELGDDVLEGKCKNEGLMDIDYKKLAKGYRIDVLEED